MAHLISVPLPAHGATYTTISHQFVIDYSKQQLLAEGFVIVDEEYRCTADGQIAQGIYKLNFNSDPELSMMFAWTNSYNKQVKFKCLVGAYINRTGSVMTSGELGTWTRKHTGSADVETKDMIDSQVQNANMYYNQLVSDKASMEGISLNKRRQAQMLGILFAEFQILTTEQASMVRSQMDRPSHVFADSNSLWAFYNYVTIALQHSHPRTWMEDQRILHYFISTVGNFTPVAVIAPVVEDTPIVDPLDSNYGQPENQTNLLVQIAETTGDDTVLLPQGISTDVYHGMNELMEADAKMLMFGDDSGYKHIQEVHDKAAQDQIIYGVSGIRVDENGSHYVPLEEVLQKMEEESPIKGDEPPTLPVEPADYDFNKTVDYSKVAYPVTEEEAFKLSDNQVVQEEVEIEPVVHQSEEMILDANEAEEDHVIIDDEIWTTEEEPQKIATILDETIQYTDPVGNTFEAPVVPCVGHDTETEKDLEQEIRETEVKNFLEEVAPEVDFSLAHDDESIDQMVADYEMMEAIESSEGTPIEANLDNVPVEKKEEIIDNSFDLDFVSDDTEESGDDIPDFF